MENKNIYVEPYIIDESILSKAKEFLDKGKNLAKTVWDTVKIESSETKLAFKILVKLLRGENVTSSEKFFLKKQSGDLLKILPLVAIQGVPGSTALLPILFLLGKKYGIDLIPRDHRYILQMEIKNMKKTELITLIESIVKKTLKENKQQINEEIKALPGNVAGMLRKYHKNLTFSEIKSVENWINNNLKKLEQSGAVNMKDPSWIKLVGSVKIDPYKLATLIDNEMDELLEY